MAATIQSLRAVAVGIKKEINVEEYRLEKEMKAALGVGPKPVPIPPFSPSSSNTQEMRGIDSIPAPFDRVSVAAPVIPIYSSTQPSPSASVNVSRVSSGMLGVVSGVMPSVGAGVGGGVGTSEVPLLDLRLHALSSCVEHDTGLPSGVDSSFHHNRRESKERDRDRDVTHDSRSRESRSQGCSSSRSRSRDSSITREGSTGSADADIDADDGTVKAFSAQIPSVELSYGIIYPEKNDQEALNPLVRTSVSASVSASASPVVALSPVLTDRTCDTDKGGIDISRPVAQLMLPLPDVFLNMDLEEHSNKSSNHSKKGVLNIPDSVGDGSYDLYRINAGSTDTNTSQNPSAGSFSIIHHADSDITVKEEASETLDKESTTNSMTPVQNPVPRKSKIPSLIISPPPSYSSHKVPTPRISDTLAPETYSPSATSPPLTQHVRNLDYPSPTLHTPVCVPLVQGLDIGFLDPTIPQIKDGQADYVDLLHTPEEGTEDLVGEQGEMEGVGELEQQRVDDEEVGVTDGGDDEVTVAYSSLIRQFHGNASASQHEGEGKEKGDTLSEMREGLGSGWDEVGVIQGLKPGHHPLRSSLVNEVCTPLLSPLFLFFTFNCISSPPFCLSVLFYLISLLLFRFTLSSTECRSRISLRIYGGHRGVGRSVRPEGLHRTLRYTFNIFYFVTRHCHV
jgi:hypothetical protein